MHRPGSLKRRALFAAALGVAAGGQPEPSELERAFAECAAAAEQFIAALSAEGFDPHAAAKAEGTLMLVGDRQLLWDGEQWLTVAWGPGAAKAFHYMQQANAPESPQ